MDPTERVDRAERVIADNAAAIYSALVDPDALVEWLPPQNMSARIDAFDARVGGGFRMVLSYPSDVLESGTDGPGKTTDLDDVVDVTFAALEPGAKVEWQAVFDSPDPAFAGVMTQTWTLTPAHENPNETATATRVVIEARGVPEGISEADHEVGLNSSLAQLEEWVSSPR